MVISEQTNLLRLKTTEPQTNVSQSILADDVPALDGDKIDEALL